MNIEKPVWLFHGAEDNAVSVSQSDEMVARLKELNSGITYKSLDGVGHDVWKKTYNKELLNWLLSKKKYD